MPLPQILVDGHVHIHPNFDLETFLNAALANFQQQADNAVYVLALTESKTANYFQLLRQMSCGQWGKTLTKWQVIPTEETDSLYLQSLEKTAMGIYLIAGRQIVTAENLEVLALFTDRIFPDNEAIASTVDRVVKAGGIPAIPWGFGKWMGKRGKILSELLEQRIESLCLADNGGRPQFWSQPMLLRRATELNVTVLSGSDPFPFKSQVKRAGRVGFKLWGAFDSSCPAASIRQLLQNQEQPVELYGELETLGNFFYNQVAVQYLKHFYKHKIINKL